MTGAIPRQGVTRQKTERNPRFIELWNAGTPLSQMAAEFNVTAPRISRIARSLGLIPRPSPIGVGPEPRPVDEALILTLLREGRSAKAVGDKVGVKRWKIEEIKAKHGIGRTVRKRPVRASKPKPVRVVVAQPASAPPKTIRPATRFANFHMSGAGRRARQTTQEEQQMIADHIARHGVTRLPAAALEVTTAVICPEDRAALNAYRAEQEAQWQPQQPRGVAKARMRA